MDNKHIIEVKQNILAANDEKANAFRAKLAGAGAPQCDCSLKAYMHKQ